MLSTILTRVVFPQRDIFITTSDIVVAVGPEFISLYSIQDLKMYDNQLVLPRQRVKKMDLDPVSRPFYDRGFNWMVILYKYEFFLIRLPQDISSPPRIVTLGRNPAEPGHRWLPGLIRGDAALAMYGDWTAKIITYSWDVDMTDCVFQMKDIRIPEVASYPIELSNVGLDMTSGQLVFIDRQNCIVLDTAPPVGLIDTSNGLL